MSIRDALTRDLTWNAVGAMSDIWLQRLHPDPLSPGLALTDSPDGLRIYATDLHDPKVDAKRLALIPIEAAIGEAYLDQVMHRKDWALAAASHAVELLLQRADAT